ncbi:hypothetical protein RRF57_010680 [Xylaria bambusicola]|uniref:Uncharacterized protein n=1 Tax=Xylaria bambusicola TaxID=326684 RepID=A0AAN7UWZ9_9PEZI
MKLQFFEMSPPIPPEEILIGLLAPKTLRICCARPQTHFAPAPFRHSSVSVDMGSFCRSKAMIASLQFFHTLPDDSPR